MSDLLRSARYFAVVPETFRLMGMEILTGDYPVTFTDDKGWKVRIDRLCIMLTDDEVKDRVPLLDGKVVIIDTLRCQHESEKVQCQRDAVHRVRILTEDVAGDRVAMITGLCREHRDVFQPTAQILDFEPVSRTRQIVAGGRIRQHRVTDPDGEPLYIAHCENGRGISGHLLPEDAVQWVLKDVQPW